MKIVKEYGKMWKSGIRPSGQLGGTVTQKAREELESLFWDAESPEKFISILRVHEQEISEILSTPGINVLENFQDLMKTVIGEGKFKKKKNCHFKLHFIVPCSRY